MGNAERLPDSHPYGTADMSYDVAVCLPPIASDSKTAWDELNGLLDAEGPTPDEFRELHKRLTARYPCICDLPDELIDEGVWSDGPLISNFGHRAASLGIVYSRVADVLPYLIQTANALGMVVFDCAAHTIFRPSKRIVGRETGHFVLVVENDEDRLSPTWEDVARAIGHMTPKGGPGFLILEKPDGSYAQTAGGDNLHTVEWRERQGNSFRHWIAGKEGDAISDYRIPTNGFVVTVKRMSALHHRT